MSKKVGLWDKFDEWVMNDFDRRFPEPREQTQFDVYGQPIPKKKSPTEEYIEAFKHQERKRRKGFDDFIKHYRNWPGSLDDLLREFPHYNQYLAPIPNMYNDRMRDLGF
jgi:hypothetical protein